MENPTRAKRMEQKSVRVREVIKTAGVEQHIDRASSWGRASVIRSSQCSNSLQGLLSFSANRQNPHPLPVLPLIHQLCSSPLFNLYLSFTYPSASRTGSPWTFLITEYMFLCIFTGFKQKHPNSKLM